MSTADRWDVIVVGAGNAAFSAALAACEAGASVLMLERAPQDVCGGNSRFTAGAIRLAFGGLRIIPDTRAGLDIDPAPIPGLCAAGEPVGGLFFFFNDPGGSGLMSGSVFGRMAGAAAAAAA